MTTELIIFHLVLILAPIIGISFTVLNYDKDKSDQAAGCLYSFFMMFSSFLLPFFIIDKIFKIMKPTDTITACYFIFVLIFPLFIMIFHIISKKEKGFFKNKEEWSFTKKEAVSKVYDGKKEKWPLRTIFGLIMMIIMVLANLYLNSNTRLLYAQITSKYFLKDPANSIKITNGILEFEINKKRRKLNEKVIFKAFEAKNSFCNSLKDYEGMISNSLKSISFFKKRLLKKALPLNEFRIYKFYFSLGYSSIRLKKYSDIFTNIKKDEFSEKYSENCLSKVEFLKALYSIARLEFKLKKYTEVVNSLLLYKLTFNKVNLSLKNKIKSDFCTYHSKKYFVNAGNDKNIKNAKLEEKIMNMISYIDTELIGDK